MELLEIIKNEIRDSDEKAITYERYMSLALYHEQLGYYRSDKQKVGRDGDFYTSTTVHDVFARLMASVMSKDFSEQLIDPVIVDVGSGDGRFIQSFLIELKEIDALLYNKLTYFVIESSRYHQRLIKERIDSANVRIFSSLPNLQQVLPKLNGLLFSNELLDAFPVRVVEKYDGELLEVCVGIDDNDHLIEVYKPCTDVEIQTWIREYGYPISENQRFEVPLMMTEWLHRTGEWLGSGKIYTIDYGYTDEEWRDPARMNGSLRGYRNHKLITDSLLYPGQMDLTTHIPIDTVRKVGEQHGINWLSCEPQGTFLSKHGLLNYLQTSNPDEPFSLEQKQNRAVRWLIESNQFQVMVQEKNRH
ncbi:SAM-dependent methyltransferase [Guptibacillus hwajinpoensis]|uniref:SAM-dependent MidA family methyltransferase n=1 Tax=Guptibacillus hwajinpoensis TaxID=208199 RepID=A0ABU0JZU4_9BACL|nr:SAM-dependent methyltransferase [Alkalihalobacillus hemicentroti]MDQ0481673.1 SAM-dependent MidA family methyltransferase [Alkalihalobacillus hemicentroti]